MNNIGSKSTLVSKGPLQTHIPKKFFMVMGQSNAHGQGTIDPAVDVSSPLVYEKTSANLTVVANDPLTNNTHTTNDKIGFGMSFARKYVENNGESIAILLCAKSGTSFGAGHWKKGGEQYNDALETIRTMISLGSSIAGILWHQGESDGTVISSSSYAQNLSDFVSDLRSEIKLIGNVPVIVGTLADDWLAGGDGTNPTENRVEANAAIIDAENNILNCALADLSGLGTGDLVHFDAAALRTAGERYYNAYVTLIG